MSKNHKRKIGDTVKVRSLEGEVIDAKVTRLTRRNSPDQEPTYSVEGKHPNGSKVEHNHLIDEELR